MASLMATARRSRRATRARLRAWRDPARQVLGDQDVAGAEPPDGAVADLDVDGAREREHGVAARRVVPGVGALGLEPADDDAAAGDKLGTLGLIAARLELWRDVLEVGLAVGTRVDADDRHVTSSGPHGYRGGRRSSRSTGRRLNVWPISHVG